MEGLSLNKRNTEHTEEQEGRKTGCKDAGKWVAFSVETLGNSLLIVSYLFLEEKGMLIC